MIIRLENVRLAFPQLFEAKARSEDKPNDKVFSGAFLFPDANPVVLVTPHEGPKYKAKLQDIIVKVAQEKWGAKANDVLKSAKLNNKICLKNGDAKAEYEGYAGNYFINANNKTRPTLVRTVNGVNVTCTQEDGVIYAGCYGHVSLDIWAQDNKYGKGINASLRGFQFVKDGDAFSGGGAATEDEFDLTDGTDGADVGEEDGGSLV